MNTKEIKREIVNAINKGYWSGYNKELSKEIDKLADDEAERIVNLFVIPAVSVAKRKVCPKCGETKDIEHVPDHYDCHSCGEEF